MWTSDRHSSTSRLNVSYFRGFTLGGFSDKTAQVGLRSGRVDAPATDSASASPQNDSMPATKPFTFSLPLSRAIHSSKCYDNISV